MRKVMIFALTLIFALTFLVSSALWADEWQQLSPATAPPPRFGHTMVTMDNKAYLFGGANNINTPKFYNDLWIWDEAGQIWSEVAQTNPPPARYSHVAAALDRKMYVFSGEDGAGGFLDDLWCYDPATNTWADVKAKGNPGPMARSMASAVVMDGAIWVLGGQGEDWSLLNDNWKYLPASGTWEQKTSLPSHARCEHAAAELGGKMYVYGGNTGINPVADLWKYDPAQDNWTQLSLGTGPSSRQGMGVVGSGEKMWIIGGSKYGTDLRDTWEFDAATQTWTQRSDCPVPLYIPASTIITTGISGPLKENRSEQVTALVFGGIFDSTTVDLTFKYFPELSPPPPPAPEAVPVLSWWGMVLLITLLGGAALRIQKRKK